MDRLPLLSGMVSTRYVLGVTAGTVAGSTLQTELLLPTYFTTMGGYVVITASAGGGGGSGGSTSTGGGGGGGGQGACHMCVYVPAGNSSLYIQVGAGGAGTVGNGSGNSSPAQPGADTYIRISDYFTGQYILKLRGGRGGGVAIAGTSGGAGGEAGGIYSAEGLVYPGGIAGTSGNGGRATGNTAQFIMRGLLPGGGGGGGGGASGAGGQGNGVTGNGGAGGTGAGGGGGGGGSFYYAPPAISCISTGGSGPLGGNGGSTPTSGTKDIQSLGGGGGGGGKTMAGANGNDGFLIISYPAGFPIQQPF